MTVSGLNEGQDGADIFSITNANDTTGGRAAIDVTGKSVIPMPELAERLHHKQKLPWSLGGVNDPSICLPVCIACRGHNPDW